MHTQNRLNNKRVISSNGNEKGLNKMPLEFAKEIVELWKHFIDRLDDNYKEPAKAILDEAIKSTKYIEESIQFRKYPDEKIHKIKWS